MEKLLYIHKVAEFLNCSRPMVYKLIYEGRLSAIRIGTRGIRITQDSLDCYLKENTINPNEFLNE